MAEITQVVVGGTTYDIKDAVAGTKIVTADGKTSLQAVPNLSLSYPGNTRGTGSVDLQMTRSTNYQIAFGTYSSVMGYNNTASGTCSTARGNSTTASGKYSTAIGHSNAATGECSIATGENNATAGMSSLVVGRRIQATDKCSCIVGDNNAAGCVMPAYSGITSVYIPAYGDVTILTWETSTLIAARLQILNAGTGELHTPDITVSDSGSVQASLVNSLYMYVSNGNIHIANNDYNVYQIGVFFTKVSYVMPAPLGDNYEY